MLLSNWISSLRNSIARRLSPSRRRKHPDRLSNRLRQFEHLEDRSLLTTISLAPFTIQLQEGDAGWHMVPIASYVSIASNNEYNHAAFTVQYSLTSGSAQNQSDFSATHPVFSTIGTIIFPENAPYGQGVLWINGDTLPESDETFTIQLLSGSGYDVDPQFSQQVVQILDDDYAPPVDVAIGNASVTEGDSGTVTMNFPVSMSESYSPVTITYSTANGTAQSGSDYVAKSGSLTFAGTGTPQTQNELRSMRPAGL